VRPVAGRFGPEVRPPSQPRGSLKYFRFGGFWPGAGISKLSGLMR